MFLEYEVEHYELLYYWSETQMKDFVSTFFRAALYPVCDWLNSEYLPHNSVELRNF